MKYVYLWTALAIAALVAAIVLWHMGPPNYPRVVADFPGNTTLIFIERPWSSKSRCESENERISAKITGSCPSCRITATCPTKLDTVELKALHGQPIDRPVVYTDSASILISAPTADAMSICNSMAEQVTRQKSQRAHCISPEDPIINK